MPDRVSRETSREFWSAKVGSNRARDPSVMARLQAEDAQDTETG